MRNFLLKLEKLNQDDRHFSNSETGEFLDRNLGRGLIENNLLHIYDFS